MTESERPQTALVRVEGPTADPGRASAAALAVPDAGAVLARLLADLAPRTRKTYTEHLALAARWYGVPLELLPAALLSRGRGGARLAVEAYRDALRERGVSGRPVSNGYVNVAISALQAVVRKAYQLDLVDWTVSVKRLKAAKPDMRGPGVPAVKRLLAAAAADPNPTRAARDAALLRLLYDRAVRLAEALTLDAEHLEFGGAGTVASGVPVAVRVAAKGADGARERLSLPPQTGLALAHWLAHRNRHLSGADDGALGVPAPGPLFLSLDRKLRGAAARLTGRAVEKRLAEFAGKAGVAQACRPHGLRHTAATRALEDGVPVQEVALYTRHARVQTLLDHYFDVVVDVGGKVAARVAAHV